MTGAVTLRIIWQAFLRIIWQFSVIGQQEPFSGSIKDIWSNHLKPIQFSMICLIDAGC